MLSFRRQDRDRVAAGEITVTYRLGKRAKVKTGKTYASEVGDLLVEDASVIPAALVPESDVPLSGLDSIEAIWALAGDHTKTPVGPDTLLHRVQFRVVARAKRRPAP